MGESQAKNQATKLILAQSIESESLFIIKKNLIKTGIHTLSALQANSAP